MSQGNDKRKGSAAGSNMKKGEKPSKMSDMTPEEQKKEVAKAYEKYAKNFTPKPTYFKNCIIAFIVGGAICCVAAYFQKLLAEGDFGLSKQEAGTYVTMGLVVLAQLLTGIGVFDSIAKVCGAGVVVPITGFANSMVAPALEYKKEGLVLGVGQKLFSVAGPVLVCGISTATIIGILYYLYYCMFPV